MNLEITNPVAPQPNQPRNLAGAVAPWRRQTCPFALACLGLGLGCLLLAAAIWTGVFTWMEDGRHRENRHYVEPAPYIAATLGVTVLTSAIVSAIWLLRRRQERRGWLWLISGVGLAVIGLLLSTVGFYLLTVEIR